MKSYFIVVFTLLLGYNTFAQSRETVKLKLQYKGNPLCYWEVTLKHGDVAIGKSTSDENGEVTFSGVQLMSKSVDASGYKKISNGEKKWDAKGYIALDDNFSAVVEFDKIIEESGAPRAMMEAAWGLTLNDCAGSGSGSTPNNNKEDTQKSGTDQGEEKKMLDSKLPGPADFKAQQEQQKQVLEQKLERLNKKVEEARTEQAKQTPGTKAHSDASYELRDLEIERDLTQIKLDKTNDQIASNSAILGKSERQRYNEKTDALEAEQKELRKNKKDGKMYGETGSADKKEGEEDDSKLKFYTPDELNNMSSFDLKKTKLGNNQSISKRKVKLKTRDKFLSQDEKAKIQTEIDELNKQIDLIKAVLEKRNEKEDGNTGEK